MLEFLNEPYEIAFEGEAYALPFDTLYYIEGANADLDAFVHASRSEIERRLAAYDKHLCVVALTAETLREYLSIRPDVECDIPKEVYSPLTEISGKLLCRLDLPAEGDEYTFLALDTDSVRGKDFFEHLDLFLNTLSPQPVQRAHDYDDVECCETAPMFGGVVDDLFSDEEERLYRPRHKSPSRFAGKGRACTAEAAPGAAPMPVFEQKKDVRDEFLEELQRRLNSLSDEGVNVFLQTLGNDFLKSIQNLTPKPPSKLVIDERYRILLPDYDIEIKMNALWRAIYILFLRHEEGIVLKDIGDYRDELASIYKHIASGEYERMKATIDDVTTPGSDNFRQYLSKINRAFNAVLAVDLAQHYIISGARGSAYRIRLERSNVSIFGQFEK